jgi:thioredoxin-related protein
MKISALLFFLIVTLNCSAQDSTFNVYHPDANIKEELNKALNVAKAENKNVFLQVGGNWCKWCRMFYKWSNENKTIDSLFKANYIVVHVNYSKENKNPELMKELGFPQRFGFPVFVILDSNGNRIHTQNTSYLEQGEGYSEEKVAAFLTDWAPESLKPENNLK